MMTEEQKKENAAIEPRPTDNSEVILNEVGLGDGAKKWGTKATPASDPATKNNAGYTFGVNLNLDQMAENARGKRRPSVLQQTMDKAAQSAIERGFAESDRDEATRDRYAIEEYKTDPATVQSMQDITAKLKNNEAEHARQREEARRIELAAAAREVGRSAGQAATAITNLVGTMRGAPNMYKPEKDVHAERLERLVAARRKAAADGLEYANKLYERLEALRKADAANRDAHYKAQNLKLQGVKAADEAKDKDRNYGLNVRKQGETERHNKEAESQGQQKIDNDKAYREDMVEIGRGRNAIGWANNKVNQQNADINKLKNQYRVKDRNGEYHYFYNPLIADAYAVEVGGYVENPLKSQRVGEATMRANYTNSKLDK